MSEDARSTHQWEQGHNGVEFFVHCARCGVFGDTPDAEQPCGDPESKKGYREDDDQA